MINKYKRLLNDTFIFALGNLGSRVINFFLVPIYTNILNPDEFGTVDLVICIAGLIWPALTLTIHEGLLRFGLSKDTTNENSIVTNTCLVVLAGIIVLLCIAPLFEFYKVISEYVMPMILIAMFDMVNQNLLIYSKIKGRNKLFSIASLIYTVTLSVLTIVFLSVCEMKIEGYLLAYIIAMAVMFLILFASLSVVPKIKLKYVDLPLLKLMIRYSAPLIVNNLSWWIIHSIAKLALEQNASASAVGIFAIASKIPALLAVFTSIFQQAWTLSSIVEYEGDKDKSFYTNTFQSYITILILISSCILIILEPFMRIYVGNGFAEAGKYVPVLLLGSVFNACSAFFGSIYSALKKNIQTVISTLICAVCNILLCLLLIPQYAIWGAAIATTVSYLVIAIYRCVNVRKFFYFNIAYYKICTCLLLLFIQTTLVIMSFRVIVGGLAILLTILYINRKEMLMLVSRIKKMIGHNP